MIGQVESHDLDLDENKRVTYQIVNSPGGSDRSNVYDATKLFVVSNTGEIYARQRLDREKHPKGFEFLVYARDHGNPVQSASVLVIIELDDVNDCIPNFHKELFTWSIAEDYGSDFKKRSIGVVKATDDDEGKNAFLKYRFSDNSAPFE
ncbi:hypothetical protein Ciccas_011265, partial [Cichlidogyrus casuarinus]